MSRTTRTSRTLGADRSVRTRVAFVPIGVFADFAHRGAGLGHSARVRANRVDRALVRFRATGDANALAAVFDATAPELRHPVQSTPAARSERTSWLRLEITLPSLEPE